MQKVEIADVLASTSAKTVKSSVKPRKKGSPLDEICKDHDALYALLKMISREKEAVDDSRDERSSEASVTKNPYYPYNQEWFGHDEEDTLDLPEDWLIDTPYLSGLHNSQNAIMFTPSEVPTIVLHCWSKKMVILLKRRFFMILVTS